MNPVRKTALVAGVLYLITFTASIPALVLIGPVLHNPDYITSAGADPRVVAGCLLDLVNAIAAVGTAVTLFPVVRRQNEGLALGFVASRSFEAAVIVTGRARTGPGRALFVVSSHSSPVMPGEVRIGGEKGAANN
jgi:hypothetical protein